MKRFTSYILLLFATIIPNQVLAQNDAEATIESLRPVVIRFQGLLQVDSTELFQEIWKRHSKDPETLTRISGLFYSIENPDSTAAHRVEQRVINQYPNFGYVYTSRGANAISYYADKEGGEAYMRKGIQMSPGDPRCYAPLVAYKLKSRNPQDSLEMRQLVDNLVAQVSTDADKIKAAEIVQLFNGSQEISQSLLVDIDHSKMSLRELQSFSYKLVAANQTEQAQDVLDKALALYPKDPRLHQIAFTNYIHAHDWEKARQMGDMYFSEVPKDSLKSTDYRLYASCQKQAGKYEEAVETLWKGYEHVDVEYGATNADIAHRLKLYIGDDIEKAYKEWAGTYGYGSEDKAEALFRKEMKEFQKHDDAHHTRNAYYGLADFYSEKAKEMPENSEGQIKFYEKSSLINEEIADNATSDYDKTIAYYSQWLYAYQASKAANDGRSIDYNTKLFLNYLLSKDHLSEIGKKYYYNPIAMTAYSNPELAYEFTNTFLYKFESELPDTRLIELREKLQATIQAKGGTTPSSTTSTASTGTSTTTKKTTTKKSSKKRR